MDPLSSFSRPNDTYDDFSSRPASFSSPFPSTPPQFSPTLPHRSLKSSLPPSVPKPHPITPPEEHPAQRNALGTDRETLLLSKQTDEKVISLVERWEKFSHSRPEGAVRVRLSGQSFAHLMEKLDYDKRAQKYPRYFYNSLRSEMIIQCMPSPVHENFPMEFLFEFIPARNSLPPAVRSRIDCHTNEDTNGFSGQYAGSIKTPDLKVTIEDARGVSKVKLVIEVGFAESYEDLVADARLWLDGMQSVCVVILAKYYESPPYRNPVGDLSEEDIERLQFPDVSAIDSAAFTMEGEYGPVVYNGYTWAGQLSEAFIEVWKRNPETGLAEKSGNRMNLFSPNVLNVKFSEFLDADPTNDATVSISSQNLLNRVKKALQRLACFRFVKAMTERTKLGDQEYQPSSETEEG